MYARILTAESVGGLLGIDFLSMSSNQKIKRGSSLTCGFACCQYCFTLHAALHKEKNKARYISYIFLLWLLLTAVFLATV